MSFDGQPWGTTEELLALIVEELDSLRQMYIAAHGGKPRTTVFEIQRPWRRAAPEQPKRKRTVEDIARAFGMTVPPMEERPKKAKR